MIIRRQPGDFLVEERVFDGTLRAVSELPGPKSRIAVFRVAKQSLTTPEAASKLAKAAGVKAGDVSYAGLKDKHAVTSQHMTVEGVRGPMQLPRRLGALATEGFEAELIGWAGSPADAVWIQSNRFQIVIRSMDLADVESVRGAIARLGDPDLSGDLLLLNLFGEQRFGSARHGKGFAARALIEGDFESALKLLIATPARKDSGVRRTLTRVASEHWGRWSEMLAATPKCPERRAIETLAGGENFRAAFSALPTFTQQMCVEAYQSWLWNRIALGLSASCESGKLGELRALVGISMPTLGPGVALSEPWAEAARAVLVAEGITVDSLSVPGLRRPVFGVVPRPLVMRASGVTLSAPMADEFASSESTKRFAATLSFSLPRGSYATVLLREFGC